jgi:PAS domain-containing protein
LASNELFTEVEEAREFAQAIVDTVREPFLVLDQDLRVLAASRSFCSAFKVIPPRV